MESELYEEGSSCNQDSPRFPFAIQDEGQTHKEAAEGGPVVLPWMKILVLLSALAGINVVTVLSLHALYSNSLSDTEYDCTVSNQDCLQQLDQLKSLLQFEMKDQNRNVKPLRDSMNQFEAEGSKMMGEIIRAANETDKLRIRGKLKIGEMDVTMMYVKEQLGVIKKGIAEIDAQLGIHSSDLANLTKQVEEEVGDQRQNQSLSLSSLASDLESLKNTTAATRQTWEDTWALEKSNLTTKLDLVHNWISFEDLLRRISSRGMTQVGQGVFYIQSSKITIDGETGAKKRPQEAREVCRRAVNGSILAEFDTKEEFQELLSSPFYRSSGLLSTDWWLGLHDPSHSGNFVRFSDNLAPNSTYWDIGQPNNVHGDQWCVMVASGKWNDFGCEREDSEKEFLCQIKIKRPELF